jgi:hypothetical protein
MRHLAQRWCWALAVLVLGVAGPARADLIFSNFGPGESYNLDGGPVVGLGQVVGNAFTVPTTSAYRLDSITAALTFVSGPVNSVTLSLETDINNQPGKTLESWTLTDLPPIAHDNPPSTVTSVLHPLLKAGTQYWVVASNPDPTQTSNNSWNFTSPDVQGLVWSNNSGTSIATQSAFSVSGSLSIVPEPATMTLTSVAVLIGLGAWYRHRRGDPR